MINSPSLPLEPGAASAAVDGDGQRLAGGGAAAPGFASLLTLPGVAAGSFASLNPASPTITKRADVSVSPSLAIAVPSLGDAPPLSGPVAPASPVIVAPTGAAPEGCADATKPAKAIVPPGALSPLPSPLGGDAAPPSTSGFVAIDATSPPGSMVPNPNNRKPPPRATASADVELTSASDTDDEAQTPGPAPLAIALPTNPAAPLLAPHPACEETSAAAASGMSSADHKANALHGGRDQVPTPSPSFGGEGMVEIVERTREPLEPSTARAVSAENALTITAAGAASQPTATRSTESVDARASAPRLALGHDFPDQLGIAIARHAKAGGDELTVHLHPVELGRIEVKLGFDDGGSLRAVVSSEHAHVLDQVRRDLPDLTRALGDAGVRADERSFRFERGGSTGAEGNGAGGHHTQGDQGRPSDHRRQSAQEQAPQWRRPLRRSGRLDLMA